MTDISLTTEFLKLEQIRRKRLRRLLVLRWRRRFFKHLPPISLFILLCIIVFAAGFIFFSEKVSRLAPPNPAPVADAIVVLTGGEKRMEVGLELLEKKLGARLLISGVNPNTNSQSLIRVTHADPTLFDCCVDIGHQAVNTIGNAQESLNWIRRNHYRSVYVVTNDYHMPRSMRELERLMPDIQFIAYPISDGEEKQTSWIKQYNQLRILSAEYIKYIFAEIRGWFS